MEEKIQTGNVTEDTKYGLTKADLRTYYFDNTEIDWKDYPKVTITLGDSLNAYQKGIITFSVKYPERGKEKELTFRVQVDGLMSVVYSMYAKTLNELRKATIRQKTARVWGITKKLWYKLRG